MGLGRGRPVPLGIMFGGSLRRRQLHMLFAVPAPGNEQRPPGYVSRHERKRPPGTGDPGEASRRGRPEILESGTQNPFRRLSPTGQEREFR